MVKEQSSQCVISKKCDAYETESEMFANLTTRNSLHLVSVLLIIALLSGAAPWDYSPPFALAQFSDDAFDPSTTFEHVNLAVAPAASFSADPTSGHAPLQVQCTYSESETSSMALQVYDAHGFSRIRRVASITVADAEDYFLYLPLVLRNFPLVPDPPVLNAISNDDGDGNYTVSWSASEGATTYTLQEATDANFTNATTVYSGANTLEAIGGRDVGTYYYRVRASNASATSAWSNTTSVEVTVEPQPDEWTIVTIPSETRQGANSSIAVDQDGHPHISFMDASDRAVKYVRWNWHSWKAQTIDTVEVYHANHSNTSLVLTQDGHPQIAYKFNNPIQTIHVEWDGSQWQRTRPPVRCPGPPNLALQPNGEPCISCFTEISGWHPVLGFYHNHSIAVACRTGTDWPVGHAVPWQSSPVYAHSADYSKPRSLSLAVDSKGRPQVSFARNHGGGRYYLWYVQRSTDGWVGTEVDSEVPQVGPYPSLALDSLDRAHISYYDLTNGDLKYARWTGSEWFIETVDIAGDVGRYTSLALDGDGNAHISYYDVSNRNLKYAVWDGSQWHIETVDSSGAVGEWSSLALDAAGHVHISYYDYTNGNLKYATNAGAFSQQAQ
jgi:hypothetical protein